MTNAKSAEALTRAILGVIKEMRHILDETDDDIVVRIDKQKLHEMVEANAFSFVFRGTTIQEPFQDETGRFVVNPVEYYGRDFILACITHDLIKLGGCNL